jgi:nucleotide-binding universal stress UspA family protein
MKRVMVPLDGSGLAARTVATAADLADRCGARLVLVAVVPGTNAGASAGSEAGEAEPSAARTRMEEHIDYVFRRTRLSMAPETEIAEGDPAQCILEMASRRRVDVIAMATHGRPALSRTSLGTVTQAVLRQARVPVFVLHPEILPMPWESLPPRRVVMVPLNGSAHSERALGCAVDLAAAYRARLRLVRVVDSAASGPGAGKARRDATEYLERTASHLGKGAPEVGTEVADGAPADEILRLAAAEPHALLVVASTRIGAAPASPSVGDALVQNAAVPTVVVPAR